MIICVMAVEEFKYIPVQKILTRIIQVPLKKIFREGDDKICPYRELDVQLATSRAASVPVISIFNGFQSLS